MIFVIKLNDSKNGLSSTNNEYKNNAIYIHKILNKNNINITDFDYTPDFGIMENDWIDKYHWNLDFYNKWCYWIINKISQLLLYNNLLTNTNNKLLIISDSTLDYKDNNINRKNIFKK